MHYILQYEISVIHYAKQFIQYSLKFAVNKHALAV